MTTTKTLVSGDEKKASGDSPVGGATTPPPTPAPPPPSRPPTPPREKSMLGRLTMGFMALGLGVMAILDNVGTFDTDLEPYHYLALAVTILGVGLIVGAVLGRARWLILVGAILVPTLVFSPYFGYDFDSRSFDLRTSPTSFAEVEDAYSIDLGSMVIDLTDLPWDGEEIEIVAHADAGSLEIWVPDGVGIIGSARVDVGQVSEPGRSSGGLGDPNLTWDDPGPLGTIILDAQVNLGNIEIRR